jgi:clan AA aspartic protease
MITGMVTPREARIRIRVIGDEGREQLVEAIVDTGYTAFLTLPPGLIQSLNLRWQSVNRGTLADGSECLFDVFEADVVWDGEVCRLLVSEADTDPLVGMALLNGYELKMQICPGGRLEIVRLSDLPLAR